MDYFKSTANTSSRFPLAPVGCRLVTRPVLEPRNLNSRQTSPTKRDESKEAGLIFLTGHLELNVTAISATALSRLS